MVVEKITIDLKQYSPGFRDIVVSYAENCIEARSVESKAKKQKDAMNESLKGVLTEGGWLDCRVLAGGYEITFVKGVTQDKKRFASFLETRGITPEVLAEAEEFSKKSTEGSVRVRKI